MSPLISYLSGSALGAVQYDLICAHALACTEGGRWPRISAARRAFSLSRPATQRDVADGRSPMPAGGSARPALEVAAGHWFVDDVRDAKAAAGQILPDLTRAVRGMCGRSRYTWPA